MTRTRGRGASPPSPASPARAGATPSATATLFAALLGFFMITVDALAVNVGLATMGRELHTATSGLQWVVDGYTLMFAVLLLSAGALSDRIGARRAYGSGTAAFTLASIACGAAPGLGALVAARVLQGCAAAVMLPSSLALVRQAYADQDRRRRAIALWVAAGASAVAIGPVAGGLLIAAWSWRGIFLINVPVGATVLLLLSRVARSPRRPTPLDLGGQVLAVLALGGLTYGVIEGGSAGYGAPRVMTALAVALAAGTAFAITESRTADPAVPLTLFRQQAAVSAIAGGFAASVAFYGIVFVIGLYAQQVRGYSALATGLLFVPAAAVVAAANVISPMLAARFGSWTPVIAGQIVMALGALGLLAAVPSGPSAIPVPLVAALLVPVGIGGGLSVPPLTAVLLENVAATQAGLASGVLNAVRQVGSALAVALFGSLVASRAAFGAGLAVSLLITAAVVFSAAACSVFAWRGRGRESPIPDEPSTGSA